MKDIGGPAQTVRPLVAPMAEAAAHSIAMATWRKTSANRCSAMAAATDNVGLFFGEDIFFAIASILLIQGVFEGYGVDAHAAAAFGLGDPDRDLCDAHPFRPPVCARPTPGTQAGQRCRRGRSMITSNGSISLTGIIFAIWSLLSVRDRSNGKRYGNAAFWGLLAASFLFGATCPTSPMACWCWRWSRLPAFGGLRSISDPPTTDSTEREQLALRFGNRLFLPALIVPLTAVAGTLLYNYTPLGQTGLFEARRETLILFGDRRPDCAGVGDGVAASTGACPDGGRATIDGFDRLGGDPAADARRPRRGVRAGGRGRVSSGRSPRR